VQDDKSLRAPVMIYPTIVKNSERQTDSFRPGILLAQAAEIKNCDITYC